MRRVALALVTAVALVGLPQLATSAAAAPQRVLELDPTYGDGGVALVSASDDATWPMGWLGGSDGRGGSLVVLREDSLQADEPDTFFLVRLDASGERDTTFGSEGRTVLPDHVRPWTLTAGAAGIAVTGVTTDDRLWVGRFDSTGEPLTVFSGDGQLTLDVEDAFVQSVHIGPDQRTYLSVHLRGVQPSAQLLAFTPTGALDPTFFGDGVLEPGVDPLVRDQRWALVTQVDLLGRIYVRVADVDGAHAGLLRLLPDGNLDPTWGAPDGAPNAGATVMAVSPVDGGSGMIRFRPSGGVFLDRLGPDGRMDRRFEAPLLSSADHHDLSLVDLPGGYLAVLGPVDHQPDPVLFVFDDVGGIVLAGTVPVHANDQDQLMLAIGLQPKMWRSDDGTRLLIGTTDTSRGQDEPTGRSKVLAIRLDLPRTAPTVTSVEPGRTALEVSWTAPTVDHDGPIRAFVVEARRAGRLVGSWAVAGDVRSTTVPALVDGRTYAVQVTPVTAHGRGPASLPVSARPSTAAPAVSPPGTPTSIQVTPGREHLDITWAPPLDDGGQPVVAYAVVAAEPGTATVRAVRLVAADVRAASLPSLRDGHMYDVHVLAWTPAGFGNPASSTGSPSAAAIDLGRTPTTDWVATAPADGGVLVAWGPARERGEATTGYAIVAARDGVPIAAATTDAEGRGAVLQVPGTDEVDVYVVPTSTSGYGPLPEPLIAQVGS